MQNKSSKIKQQSEATSTSDKTNKRKCSFQKFESEPLLEIPHESSSESMNYGSVMDPHGISDQNPSSLNRRASSFIQRSEEIDVENPEATGENNSQHFITIEKPDETLYVYGYKKSRIKLVIILINYI